ncbi:hypothetical protein M3Y98_00607100 [Aphelenchoides besseyi]|nr:hypothetical protein M3Y98_00607100 [Aphelenchoides besseyi]KAI6208249.1 hypothetical protein M3Y96_00095100 [Aphelenchoides besseyi]
MDFDPDHKKWQFACCRIVTGLKIWASFEIILSAIFTVLLVLTCHEGLKTKVENTELIFDFGLLTMCVLMLIGNVMLVIGLQLYQIKLMYFTIFVRTMFLIFISAFGVSRFLLRHDHVAPRKGFNDREEPSIALRLIGLVFFMLVVCAAVFYTIYLIVQAIRYTIAYNRLQDRRQSLILASQIGLYCTQTPSYSILEPEMLAHLRRKSNGSKGSGC